MRPRVWKILSRRPMLFKRRVRTPFSLDHFLCLTQRLSRWCNTGGSQYCSAPTCQIDYGPACDANIRPNGPSTDTVPRPKVGSIPYGSGIYRCNVQGTVALTFDDGPWIYTDDLLDLLDVSIPRA